MKFYLDEDLSPQIAEILRKKDVDCISAHEAEMTQASDIDQLRFSADKKRCLVNRNRDHFIRLTVEFFNDYLPHHGLLIVPYSIPGDQFSQIAHMLADYSRKHPKGLPSYTIDFLSVNKT